MPCPACNDALNFSDDYSSPVETIADLERSATSCGYCQILLSLVRERKPETDRICIYSDERQRCTKGVRLVFRGADGYTLNEHEYSVCNLRDLGERDRLDVCATGLVNTGSDAAVAWTKEKLSACREEHELCNMRNEYRVLPDRVLKIGAVSSDDVFLEADVRLYESHGEKTDYVALSHRWGDKQPLRLLQGNHAEFQHGIAWSALPKTFQHAITFARKLGISYVWIDSLCIIQDSKQDWLEQSGKMAAIYENASVTLAATVSDGGESGMFVEPTALQKGHITDGKAKFPADMHSADMQRLLKNAGPVAFVKHKMTLSAHPFPGHFRDSDLSLLTRGWVYQERLLSPRIVHFGKLDITWECNDDMTCYCNIFMPSYSRDPIGRPVKPQHAQCLVSQDENAHTMAARWIRIVEAYTALDLTVASDRFPAIAGIAKQFRRALGNKKYLAGLWEESLSSGLMWARKDAESQSRAAQHQIPSVVAAPSWSWLSVTGAVHYPCSRYLGAAPYDAPALTNIAFPRGADAEFTTLCGGSITLHGKLLTGTIHIVRGRDWQNNELLRHKFVAANNTNECEAWMDDGVFDESAQEVECLFMGRVMEDGAISMLFMIMRGVQGRKGVYRRVGLGRYGVDEHEGLFGGVKGGRDVMVI